MTLPARTMHIQSGLPIDESTRPELLDAGTANVANRNMRGIERSTLEKRLGYSVLSSARLDTTTRASGARLFSRAENPCVIDASANLDQYMSSIGKWSTTGPIPEAMYTLQSVPSPTTDANIFDSAFANGMIAIAYGKSEDSAALMAVVDATDGGVISPITLLGTSPGDRGFHAVGAIKDRYFIAVTTSFLDTSIFAYVLDTNNVSAGWLSLGTIETDLGSQYPSICALDDRVIVAYAVGSGSNRVAAKALDETGIIDSTTISTATFEPALVDIDGSSSDVVWIAYDLNGTVRCAALSPTSLSTVIGAPTGIPISGIDDTVLSLRVCAGDTQNAQVWLMYKRTAIDGSHPSTSQTTNLTIASSVVVRGHGGVANTTIGVYANTIINSRPMFRAGRYYVVVAAGTGDPEAAGANDQGTCILVEWTLPNATLRPVTNIEPALSTRLQIWSKINAVAADLYCYARQFIRAGSEQTSTGAYGAALVMFDFVSALRWDTVEHNGVTPIGGGVVGVWDGADFTELGFLTRPRPPTVIIVTPGTGSHLTGAYRYVAIFEDVDATGNVVVSGVSATTLVTLTNQTTRIAPQIPVVTYRTRSLGTQSRVRTAVYRTVAGGEPPYYLLGFVPASANLADDMADVDLAARPKLYAPNLPGAAGESLDRRAPPQLANLISYSGMLVGTKGSSIFYSGQPVYGEATWFSPAFEVQIPSSGEITALASIDGNIIAFKAGSIYVVAGESPSDNGAAGGLGEPRVLATDVGCIDARSVVVTSLGVFFQSRRGIELLTRSQTVTWIGEPMVDDVEAYPIVTSVVLDDRNSLVRFSLAVSENAGVVGTNGVDIVFDTSINAWVSTDDKRGSVDAQASQHAARCFIDGSWRYAWLGSDGVVYAERDDGDGLACRDGAAWVTASYTTPPIKFGLQQEQRIYEFELTLEKHSAAGLRIEVGEDYGAFGAITADKVWTDAVTDGESIVPFRTRSHGHAVQLRISDTDPMVESDGRGITFIGLSSDLAPKQGATRGTSRIATSLRR